MDRPSRQIRPARGRPPVECDAWPPNDDLLAGFDRAGRPAGLRAFFASTIALSLVVRDLTLSLGAYHTVFYYRLFQILVASTVLLHGAVVLRRDVRVRPWMHRRRLRLRRRRLSKASGCRFLLESTHSVNFLHVLCSVNECK